MCNMSIVSEATPRALIDTRILKAIMFFFLKSNQSNYLFIDINLALKFLFNLQKKIYRKRRINLPLKCANPHKYILQME